MTLEHLPLFAGPAAIMALCAVLIRWPDVLSGWRFGAWCTIGVILIGLMLRHLMPDLDSARPLLATVSVGLGIPATGLLSVAIAERWRWRHTIPLAVTSAVCGVLHSLTPAYAADPVAAVTPAVAADPLSALLVALASGQVPSGVTMLIVAGLMLRKVHELLEKIEKIQWKFIVTLDPETALKEVHHYPTEVRHAPSMPPDEGTDERSGVRRAPRAAR